MILHEMDPVYDHLMIWIRCIHDVLTKSLSRTYLSALVDPAAHTCANADTHTCAHIVHATRGQYSASQQDSRTACRAPPWRSVEVCHRELADERRLECPPLLPPPPFFCLKLRCRRPRTAA
jgi:hypothetical protein